MDGAPGQVGALGEKPGDRGAVGAVDRNRLVGIAAAAQGAADMIDGIAEAAAGHEQLGLGLGGIGQAAGPGQGNAVKVAGGGRARRTNGGQDSEEGEKATKVRGHGSDGIVGARRFERSLL